MQSIAPAKIDGVRFGARHEQVRDTQRRQQMDSTADAMDRARRRKPILLVHTVPFNLLCASIS
jgi:hypothetical protein